MKYITQNLQVPLNSAPSRSVKFIPIFLLPPWPQSSHAMLYFTGFQCYILWNNERCCSPSLMWWDKKSRLYRLLYNLVNLLLGKFAPMLQFSQCDPRPESSPEKYYNRLKLIFYVFMQDYVRLKVEQFAWDTGAQQNLNQIVYVVVVFCHLVVCQYKSNNKRKNCVTKKNVQ